MPDKTRTTSSTAMAELARLLSENDTLGEESLLNSITSSAVDNVPGVEYCGITLVEKKTFTSVAPSDPTAKQIDDLQNDIGQGPCLEAAWEHHMVHVDDYETETRWPAFVTEVRAHTPVRSSMSFQLYRSETTMGAINMHSSRANVFTPESEEVGLAFATHAALAVYSSRRDDQFASALASRDTIGQAKGMIMERFNIDAIQAWELIRKLSQDANIRVFELAQQLIDADHPPRPRNLLD